MFLDFLRKVKYGRMISFILIGLIAALTAIEPQLSGTALSVVTFLIAVFGFVKGYLPYQNPSIPIDSKLLNQ
jgi:hypothetical protein